jgi:hypothetical protein
LLSSFKVTYRVVKDTLDLKNEVLPATFDIVATLLGASYAKEFRKIPLEDNTVGRRISDIREDVCDQLIDELQLHVLLYK